MRKHVQLNQWFFERQTLRACACSSQLRGVTRNRDDRRMANKPKPPPPGPIDEEATLMRLLRTPYKRRVPIKSKLVTTEQPASSKRKLDEFQRRQMKDRDARIPELFVHVRAVVDLVEQIWRYPFTPPQPKDKPKPKIVPASESKQIRLPTFDKPKLAYTIREVRGLIGISHTSIYNDIRKGKLRSVKYGKKTLIMAADLQAWLASWK